MLAILLRRGGKISFKLLYPIATRGRYFTSGRAGRTTRLPHKAKSENPGPPRPPATSETVPHMRQEKIRCSIPSLNQIVGMLDMSVFVGHSLTFASTTRPLRPVCDLDEQTPAQPNLLEKIDFVPQK